MESQNTSIYANIFILVSCMVFSGCGGGGDEGSMPVAQDVAFAINTGTTEAGSLSEMVGFTADPNTGALNRVSSLDLQTSQGASIAALPNGKFLFAAQEDSSGGSGPRLKAFVVDKSTGQITPSCTTLPLNRSVVGRPVLEPHETVGFLPSFGVVDVFRIDATNGCPSGISFVQVESAFNVQSLAPHPNGTLVYALLRKSLIGTSPDAIRRYTLNRVTEVLEAQEAISLNPANGSSTDIQVHPSGQFVYAANPGDAFTATSGIFAFRTGTAGQLTIVPGSPFTGTLTNVAIYPGGQFLYGVSGATNKLAGYSIDTSTGVLTPLSGLPDDNFPIKPRVSFSPNGNFAYIGSSSGLLIYKSNSNGSLTPLPSLTVPTGDVPGGLVAHTWEDVVVIH